MAIGHENGEFMQDMKKVYLEQDRLIKLFTAGEADCLFQKRVESRSRGRRAGRIISGVVYKAKTGEILSLIGVYHGKKASSIWKQHASPDAAMSHVEKIVN